MDSPAEPIPAEPIPAEPLVQRAQIPADVWPAPVDTIDTVDIVAPQVQPGVRASDAEREETVSRLSVAAGEGRLTLEELGVRVSSAYSATTRAELEHVLVDLPVPVSETGTVEPVEPRRKPKRHWIVSIMGEHHRDGRWRMSPRTTVVTVMGESSIDLRGAVLDGRQAKISSYLMMGEMRLIVPRGVEVEVTGFVLMGSRKVRVEDAPLRPGTPTVHIRCIGMMGEVRIESR